MHYNICLKVEKNFYFLLKKLFNVGSGWGRDTGTRRGRG